MESTLIAVDLAKNVFEIAVSRKPGKVAERHRLSRVRFLPFFAERQPTTVRSRRPGRRTTGVVSCVGLATGRCCCRRGR
jgi:hypothetical protein